MQLRSSSTPVIESLLSPFSDSPNRDFDTNSNTSNNRHPPFLHHSPTKFSLPHKNPLNLSSFSCNSSPISHFASGFSEFNQKHKSFIHKPFRRAFSDGNLKELASSSCNISEFHNWNRPKTKRFLHKPHNAMLRTVPSFSIYNSMDEVEDGEENKKEEGIESEELVKSDGCLQLERSITIGESIDAIGSGEFCFGRKCMALIEEGEGEEEEEEEKEGLNGFQSFSIGEEGELIRPISPPLYLATGLGIDSAGFDCSGGVDFAPVNIDENGDVEEHYKRMVDDYPCHPLFLRNYAQLLQTKGDLHGAEDYFYRATLADPGDGEIVLQYAKLVWELHHDQDRASTYFELAAQAAPKDSHVLAAYASFLWEMEDSKEEDNAQQISHIQIGEEKSLNELHKPAYEEENEPVSPLLHLAAGFGIEVAGFGGGIGGVEFTTANFGEDGNIEEYYKKMVEKNPCNPLFLRNYAQFLYQSKGDHQGAEGYYSRAILADPGDGEIMSQYAKLVWELHHDRDKALSYFERAVQATPGNCHVLAAYARFLWETEEDEEDQIQLPIFQGVATTANA